MALIAMDIPIGNIGDITVPTSTQQYTLGRVERFKDTDTNVINEYMYVKSHAGLTQYQPYVVTNSGTAGSEWITAAPITLASAVSLVCVPQVAFTSGYYGWVLIKGRGTALVASATTATHACQLYTAGTSLTTEGATTKTINSCAWAIATTTGAGSTTVMLPGCRVEIKTT